MSYALYDLSAKRTIAAVFLMLVPVFIALVIVYGQIIDPEVLAYFADALDLAVLGVILFVSLFLGIKVKKMK